MKAIDITGQKFNRLTAVGQIWSDQHGKRQWVFRCAAARKSSPLARWSSVDLLSLADAYVPRRPEPTASTATARRRNTARLEPLFLPYGKPCANGATTRAARTIRCTADAAFRFANGGIRSRTSWPTWGRAQMATRSSESTTPEITRLTTASGHRKQNRQITAAHAAQPRKD